MLKGYTKYQIRNKKRLNENRKSLGESNILPQNGEGLVILLGINKYFV